MRPFREHWPPKAALGALRRTAFAGRRGKVLRIFIFLALTFFILTSLGAMIAPWLFSAEALSRSVSGQLQTSSGLFVMTRGPSRLVLTPRPHIVAKDVAFADLNGGLLIEAPELNCTLNLGRLLAGRVQVTTLTLVQPRATIDADKGPIVAPGAVMRASLTRPETPEAQKADAARLGVINIVDGVLTIKRRGEDQIFEKIIVSLDWPRVGQPALIAGGVDWRGERHEAMMWIARPGLLLRHEQSFIATRLDGKNLTLEAQGFVALGEHAHFSGHLAGRAAAAREALQLFDIHPRMPGSLLDAEFSAEAEMDDKEARFRDLHMRVDGNVFDGDATLRNAANKFEISATLKSSFVSLAPMLADLPAMVASDGQWSREPLDLPDLKALEVNIRLDTAHARLGPLTMDHGALTLLAHDGALELGLNEARAYGGQITAQAQLRPLASGIVAAHGVALTQKVDAGALLWDVFGQHKITGALDAEVSLDAKGANIDAMMRGLTGQANLTLVNGDVEGADFPRALKLLSTNPLASAQAARTGGSRLTTASATIGFTNGLGVARGDARGEDYALSLSGDIKVPERILSLTTVAREIQPSNGAPDDRLPGIVFDLTGGWDSPSWRPQPQSFILRSGAAATLLPPAGSAAPPSP